MTAKNVEFGRQQHTARSSKCQSASIQVTQGAILRLFAPQGWQRHVTLMGVEFGMEEWTEAPLIHANLTTSVW